jgi:hypothetical protein
MGDVIPFEPSAPLASVTGPTPLEDVDTFAARTAREPFWLDAAEIPAPFRAALAAAVAEARRDLEPGRPAEIVEALATLADRHRLDLPDRRALEMDAEVMAAWPRDLWLRAYRTIWERWSWRRMPTVGDFRGPIGDAIERRRQRYGLLTTLEVRLRARTRPGTVPDCIAALERTGPGVRQTWFQAALRRDPTLTPADRTDLARWVPVVAPRIARVGLFGPTDE